MSEATETGMPAAFISCTSVTPRQRGVRPATRSCRYMLHMGSTTMEMPASATRATVSRAKSSGWMESEQQWPHMMLPLKPRLSAVSAISRSARAPLSPLSSTCRSRSRPRASASAKKWSSSSWNAAGSASWTPPVWRVTMPSVPPLSATTSASSSPSGPWKRSSGAMETICSSIRPDHSSRSFRKSGQVVRARGK